jgi:hypothetical protein
MWTETGKSQRPVLNLLSIRQWLILELLFHLLLNNLLLFQKASLPQSRLLDCLLQLTPPLLLAFLLLSLFPVPKAHSKDCKGMASSVNMVDTDKLASKNLLCLLSRMTPLASKRHLAKVRLRAIQISKHNLRPSHRLVLSRPRQTTFLPIIQRTLSNAMLITAITSNNSMLANKAHRVNRKARALSKDLIVVMAAPKRSRVEPNRHSHVTQLLVKVKRAVTRLQIQLLRLSSNLE